jgi:hypothetical protein
MADESKTKQRLEIAHVLFMDIVGIYIRGGVAVVLKSSGPKHFQAAG